MVVRELELDLDAFEGPFDLLLTLVLKEELDLAEVDVAGIVVAFVERLAERERSTSMRAASSSSRRGAARAEGARAVRGGGRELAELEPEEAAEELARRLAEYRRSRPRRWPVERLGRSATASSGSGPAPLCAAPSLPRGRPRTRRALAARCARSRSRRRCRRSPHGAPFPAGRRSSSSASARVLRPPARFDFDAEIERALARRAGAVAFLASSSSGRPARSGSAGRALRADPRIPAWRPEGIRRRGRAWTVRSA